MKTVVFFGDSITDAGRNRETGTDLGSGYPAFVAGRLGLANPGAYTFWNRGVGGDRVVDLYARVKADVLNLKPDYLSILVGINDVWHEKMFRNGVSTSKFRLVYRLLLEEILEQLPGVNILLMEPFVLKGSAAADDLDWFREEVSARAAVVQELAESFHLRFLPLQKGLDSLEQTAPEGWWLADGVHPTPSGHQYLADCWLKAFGLA